MEISFPSHEDGETDFSDRVRIFSIKAALGHATLKSGYMSDADLIASAKVIEDYITNGK